MFDSGGNKLIAKIAKPGKVDSNRTTFIPFPSFRGHRNHKWRVPEYLCQRQSPVHGIQWWLGSPVVCRGWWPWCADRSRFSSLPANDKCHKNMRTTSDGGAHASVSRWFLQNTGTSIRRIQQSIDSTASLTSEWFCCMLSTNMVCTRDDSKGILRLLVAVHFKKTMFMDFVDPFQMICLKGTCFVWRWTAHNHFYLKNIWSNLAATLSLNFNYCSLPQQQMRK